ncbi:MAG: DUF1292 domain-containing protein [Clostridiales bacterium]|nr:DUF1292 domain-containing protein [Clostridiales bacterium]
MKDENNLQQTTIQEEDEIITLTFDDGSQEEFYNIAELDYKDKWYIYLQPVRATDDIEEDEVLIYEMAFDEDGQEVFLPVTDDDLLNDLVEMLNEEIQA